MLLEDRVALIKKLETTVAETKSLVEAYLANTSEPIDERWALYQALPSFLRNHCYWQQDFLIKTDRSFGEIYAFTDFNRNEVIDVHSFIEEWSSDLASKNIDIIATKEYILSKNLGSFENDW